LLQPLLADRFQLKFHRETKELPLYELVVDKNGSKLKKSGNSMFSMPRKPDRGAEFPEYRREPSLAKLGLNLKSTKGPIEVLVIDHVERPTDS
jgi:hypothetical protein